MWDSALLQRLAPWGTWVPGTPETQGSRCFLWHPRNCVGIWPESGGPIAQARTWQEVMGLWLWPAHLGFVPSGWGVSASGSKLTQDPPICLWGWEGKEQLPQGILQSHPHARRPDASWAGRGVPFPDLEHLPQPGCPPDCRMWPLLFSGELLPPPRPPSCG